MKDILLQALGSDPLVSIAMAIAGTAATTLFTALRSKVKRESEVDSLLEFVEKGVNETYETYVREIKASGQHGTRKLTKEQRRDARAKARAFAIEHAKTAGVELVTRMGSAALDNWIQRLVTEKKTLKTDE